MLRHGDGREGCPTTHPTSIIEHMASVINLLANLFGIIVVGLGTHGLIASAARAAEKGEFSEIGEWRTPANVRVQVHTCGEAVCARIVKLPNPSVKDLSNPDARLRARPILGIQIFAGIRRIANSGWANGGRASSGSASSGWEGHMYVPESGYTYVSRLTLLDRNQLQAEMCGPMGLFCTHEVWTRTR
jgi:uncharacterized protein (DUF2147 family)